MEEVRTERRGRKPMSDSQRREKTKYGFVLKSDLKARRKQLEEAIKKYDYFNANCRQLLENLGIDDILDMIKTLPQEQRERLKNLL